MTSRQLYGGIFLIAAGLIGVLGAWFGFEHTGFLFPLVLGVLMLVIPATDVPANKQYRRRRAGGWLVLAGLISGLAWLGVIPWTAIGPLWLVGTGAMLLLFPKHEYRTEEA